MFGYSKFLLYLCKINRKKGPKVACSEIKHRISRKMNTKNFRA